MPNISRRELLRLGGIGLATAACPGLVQGQSQSNWVNPGQVASVKITKVMNVAVTYSEKAEDIPGEQPYRVSGSGWIKRKVSGTVKMENRRNEEITLHLNALLLGVGAAEKIEPTPTHQTVSPKHYALNDLTDLFWELRLKPGESQTVTVSGTRWYRWN